MRSFTHAETASEMSESIEIQTAEQHTMGTTIHRCDQVQPPSASPAGRENRFRQGTQGPTRRSKPITAHFPSTNSGRINGRLKNSGRAPFTNSPAPRAG